MVVAGDVQKESVTDYFSNEAQVRQSLASGFCCIGDGQDVDIKFGIDPNNGGPLHHVDWLVAGLAGNRPSLLCSDHSDLLARIRMILS